MKILMTSLLFDVMGGTQYSTQLLCDALIDDGHEICIATITKETGTKVNKYKIIPLKCPEFIPVTVGMNSRLLDYYLSLQLKKVIKKEKPDIVHIQDQLILPASIIAAKKHKIPTVVTIRDYVFKCNIATCFKEGRTENCNFVEYSRCLWAKFNEKYRFPYVSPIFAPFLYARPASITNYLKKADAVIAVSDFIKNLLMEAGINNVRTIYNIAPDWDNPAIEEKADDKVIIFSAGRLEKKKGFHVLIKAMKDVVRENKNVELIIAGEKPYRHELEKLVRELELDEYVQFVGRVPFNEMKEYYFKSDIVVMPSIWIEPLSRILLEALAAGKPIIATTTGGTPEAVIHGTNGLLVEPNNSKQISDAVNFLISNEEKRKEMGEAGRKMAKTMFSPPKAQNQYQNIYKEIIKHKEGENVCC